MKKTILALLLALCMVVCFATFTVSAEETTETTEHSHCVCGGAPTGEAEHTCEAITWQPLPEGTNDLGKVGSGNYYLTADVTITGTTALANGTDLKICLNGHNITTTTGRVIGNAPKSTVTFTDCSYDAETGTWDGTVTGGNSTLGTIMYTRTLTTLNIYGGNFTGNGTTVAWMGGLFIIAQDGAVSKTDPAEASTFNLYNGHLSGGKAGVGGNVHVMHAGTFNMYGGTVTEGEAHYYKSGSNVKNGQGGNVIVDGSATLNMYGGEISNGKAVQNTVEGSSAGCGGNIALSGTLNMYGGEIYGGYAMHNPTTKADNAKAWSYSTPGRGGNIWAVGAKPTINMYGGAIYDGKANGIGGGNIWFESTASAAADKQKATFNLSGGKIWGGIANADNDAAGSAHLTYAYEVCGGSVRIQSGTFNMTGGTVGIDANGNPAGGTTLPGSTECGNCYFYSGVNTVANLSGGEIAYGNTWLDEEGNLVKGKTGKGGNIGGSGKIIVSGDMIIRDGYATGQGGNWTLFNNGVSSITGGTISGGTAPVGGNIIVSGGNTTSDILTITGGTITGGTAATRGGNIAIDNAYEGINMTGGTISGGTSPNGGDLYLFGKATIDCAIEGWDVCCNTYGLTLGENFSAENVAVNSMSTTNAVVVSSYTSEAQLTGIISADADKELTIIDNKLYQTGCGHVACYCGGTREYLHEELEHTACTMIYSWADLEKTLEGLELVDSTVLNKPYQIKTLPTGYYVLTDDLTLDHHIYIAKSTKVFIDLNGHTLTFSDKIVNWGGLAVAGSAELYISDSSFDPTAATVEEKFDGAIVSNSTSPYALMYVSGSGWTRVFGGKLIYGGTEAHTGPLLATSGRFDLFHGYINGGKSTTSAASVAVYDAGSLLVWTGGEITGGEAASSGGNVLLNTEKAKLYVNGGTISNGKAASGGNIYAHAGATINMKDGTVTGGIATGNGGNIYLNVGYKTVVDEKTGIRTLEYARGAILNLSGGVISNGATGTKNEEGVYTKGDGGTPVALKVKLSD